jgi:hypothetical protein
VLVCGCVCVCVCVRAHMCKPTETKCSEQGKICSHYPRVEATNPVCPSWRGVNSWVSEEPNPKLFTATSRKAYRSILYSIHTLPHFNLTTLCWSMSAVNAWLHHQAVSRETHEAISFFVTLDLYLSVETMSHSFFLSLKYPTVRTITLSKHC